MSPPTPDQFGAFFQAVHGFAPFPWQERLAARACAGDWPREVALPAAAGKTACIDVAVFALACRAKGAPRRIFFVVDRRPAVDHAWAHASKLAAALRDPEPRILREVAAALRALAGGGAARPLEAHALRGGMGRESAWARSPLQPAIITSTVDQVGSRLLFRGYGVPDSMKPVHAGVVGNDSLILLDGAHCARPFGQTVHAVERYREWGDRNTAPFRFVSITATPGAGGPLEAANAADLRHPVLGKRIRAGKPATLVVADKAKGKNGRAELVKALARHAKELATPGGCVGVVVNCVAAARELAKELGGDAVLLTGRMRPLDCDRLLAGRLRPLMSGEGGTPPQFVVGTQCLECTDFDFHALVTECASLDALRQRFGRLNRVAARPSTKAVVVVRGDEAEGASGDSVYGESLANTWKWLNANAAGGVFDFGTSAVRKRLAGVPIEDLERLNAPAPDAPVLFPAHLDCWVQTHPVPDPDPDPAAFLHGPERPGRPAVSVVLRSDLGEDPASWAEIVALCPPSSFEAVTVPAGVLKAWMADELGADDTADLEGGPPEGGLPEGAGGPGGGSPTRLALRWRGPNDSDAIADPNDVTPNDTYVIACSRAGVDGLGDFPPGPASDSAEEAFQRSRDRALLRLTDSMACDEAGDFDARITADVDARLCPASPEWLKRAVGALRDPKAREVDRHPLGGWVVTGTRPLGQFDPTASDDGEPTEGARGVTARLDAHSRGVADQAARFAAGCGLGDAVYAQAGLWHDLGKLDPRFQAMLRQSSPRLVAGPPLAGAAESPRTERERARARAVHQYPRGARHELLSAAMVATRADDDLLLHLIATHHGRGRPLADAVADRPEDSDATPFRQELFGEPFECGTFRQQVQRWNSELPERFWRVVRKFGWWGSAYREAIFRLADHAQSAAERDRVAGPAVAAPTGVLLRANPPRAGGHPLPLPGLDGTNPLAFLAALGTLVACDRLSRSDKRPDWLFGRVALSWGAAGSPNTPTLHFAHPPPPAAEFAGLLADLLKQTPERHPMASALAILERGEGDRPPLIRRFHPPTSPADRPTRDWLTALLCETNPALGSQLQTVRRDFLIGNIRSVMDRTGAEHLRRSLFETWDYADSLHNQSLHWEPGEDRRHAYQWLAPAVPRSRETGGMLGANRLALEAWPLFPSFVDGERLRTRGFRRTRAAVTYWTWPLWSPPLTPDGVATLLGLRALQSDPVAPDALHGFGVTGVYRSRRILAGNTPNLTLAIALA